MLSTTLLTVLALAAAPQAQDPHFYAFEGCWRVTPAQEASPLVCMTETGNALVMSTYVKGELKSEQRIHADGTARTISEGGCNGEETGRWSVDGSRIFVNSRLSCGTGMERLTSSVIALTGPESMVEVRSLRVGDGATVRTVRYTEVPRTEFPAGFQVAAGRELARETARLQASAALDLADVTEASKLIDAGAVEGLLAARASGFTLSAGTLRQLKAAGVPRSTLDLMVALSYPEAFRVAEDNVRQPNRADYGSPYYDPFLANPYYRYDCYGLNYYSSWGCDYRYGYGSYGYSPYGNRGYGGYYSPYGYYGNGGIIVVPVGGDEGQGGTVGAGGYTRGSQPSTGTARRREPQGSDGTRASTYPSGGGSARAGGSSGSSGGSSGGSVGSGGYTSGGSSGSSGTAKPRGGGK